MAVVGHRDLEVLRAALARWLECRLGEATAVRLAPIVAPDAGGSSETLFVRAYVTERGQEREARWVLRIEPTANQIYKDAAVARQSRVMRALGELGAVPVPQVVWDEPDPAVLGAPFFLMEHVTGEIPDAFHHSKGLLAAVAPAVRERIWLAAIEMMACIHAADLRSVGFLARPERGATGLDQEIATWDAYVAWSAIQVRPVQERARRWLAERMPAERPTGLAWGDARPGNMIFRDGRCVAVIDWETASLGGAETDLGWWLFYDWFMSDGIGVARLDGLPDRAETVRAWEGCAGRRAQAMEWHEVFATWRFSLISDRARLLMRRRGQADVPPPDQPTPHSRRLEMLVGG